MVGAGTPIVLQSFSIPYGDASFLRTAPAMALSQHFVDIGHKTMVETAIPIRVPEGKRWDVRAVTFDVMVGRRPIGSEEVFDFRWDASELLQNYGAFANVYYLCAPLDPDEVHALGQPCERPRVRVHTERTGLVHQKHRYSWGFVYSVNAFFSREPDSPGVVMDATHWISYVGEIPSVNETLGYEYKHWMPLYATASSDTDLSIIDHDNILGRGWTRWMQGQTLSEALFQGVPYPSPGYQLVGFESDAPPPPTSDPATGSPSTRPPPTSAAVTPTSHSEITIGAAVAIAVGSCVGLILLVFCLIITIGLYRRWRRGKERRERFYSDRRQSDPKYKPLGDHEHDPALDSLDAYQRSRTDHSTGRPMKLDSPSLASPQSGRSSSGVDLGSDSE
jgi:hypothetical protein